MRQRLHKCKQCDYMAIVKYNSNHAWNMIEQMPKIKKNTLFVMSPSWLLGAIFILLAYNVELWFTQLSRVV